MQLNEARDHAAYHALAEIDGGEDPDIALNRSLLIAQPLLGLLGEGEECSSVDEQTVTCISEIHPVRIPSQ
jgi:hypothetical protein